MLVCFWGKLKTSDYLKNNPFMESEYYEQRNVTLQTLIDNYKQQFSEFDIEFLLSTWDNQNLEEYESQFKYILKHSEPSDWEAFLDEINFPHNTQIRNHPVYHVNRPGPYVRMFHTLEISNFLKNHNLEYNSIMFSRTDIYFEIKDKTVIDFTKDVCYTPEIYWGSRGHTYVNDHIMLGKYQYVLNALHIDSIESMHETLFHAWNPEEFLFKTIKKNNAEYEEFVCNKYCRFPIHMR